MFGDKTINEELASTRKKIRTGEDEILNEVKSILNNDLVKEKKVLSYLKNYFQSFEIIDESEADKKQIFTEDEIKDISIKYRLRFLDSKNYKEEYPYAAILKISDLNKAYRKDLRHFKILACEDSFRNKNKNTQCVLFALTNNGNYFFVHEWGDKMKWYKKWLLYPLRNFESMFISIAMISLVITVSLPVSLVTYDKSAPYWCDYRIGAFFHLFIFFFSCAAYLTFAFNKNFSKNLWKRELF